MIKLTKLKQTCLCCPSQWEGRTDDKRPIYIRYRWGYLSVRLGERNRNIAQAVKSKEIFGKSISDEFDGLLETQEMLKITKDVLKLEKTPKRK